MTTLYRKYRPQNFKEAVGQNHIKLTLEHEIQSGNIAHAYIFCGPRAVGKTTLARVFAKAINCAKKKEGDADPCNKCEICEEITSGRSLDVFEIDAASHTGVENVRENVIASARTSPSRCKYKVFIIDEAHMLTTQAFNALLKIIEEPPAFVVFILCTTEIHKVPTTIISRCQRFDFKRISVSDVVKKLTYIINKEDIKVNKSILEAIARNSEGHMRDAESLLGQIVAIGGKEITQEEADLVIPRSDLGEAINLIEYLSKKDCANGIKLANKLVDEGVDLKIFLNDFIEILRKVMITKINPSLSSRLGLELGESLEIKINEISQNLQVEQLSRFIERFMLARNELKNSFIIQLPIELAITELCLSNNTITPKNVQPPTPAPASTPTPQENTKPLNININKKEISEKWNEVLAKIKKYNHSLSFILRVCEPRDLNGNQICLAFKYKFHKDRVDEPSIKATIEKVLKEVYNAPIIVEAIIDESLEIANGVDTPRIHNNESNSLNGKIEVAENKKENEDGGDMMNNLLKTFGGKVVN